MNHGIFNKKNGIKKFTYCFSKTPEMCDHMAQGYALYLHTDTHIGDSGGSQGD